MSATEKDDLIGSSYQRLDGALAAPLDGLERVARRMAVRRRTRRVVRAGLAAVVVVGGLGGVALAGGGDDPDGSVAIDRSSGPVSTLTLLRPDGSRYAFEEVTVTCEAPAGADTGPEEQIWMVSPRRIEGERLLEPFLYFEGVVAEIGTGRTVELSPGSLRGDSSEAPLTLFVADVGTSARGNEVSSSEVGAAGTVRVVRAACSPTPVLELEVDATLGSEVEQGPLDVAGTLR